MKNNIVFLDVTQNYGYGFSASNTKIRLVAKGLNLVGDTCTIHNGLVGTNLVSTKTIVEEKGVGRVITLRKKGGQIYSWVRNIKELYVDLKSLYNKESNNIVILGYNDYHLFIINVFLSRLLKYQISIISHEWAPTASSVRWYRKPYIWIYTKTFGYFADSILPISEYIINRIKHYNKPYYKLPILGEFDSNDYIPPQEKKPYFVYCGSADYYRVITIIIGAMKALKFRYNNEYKLIMILGGTERGKRKVLDSVSAKNLDDSIQIRSKVSSRELINLYRYALALLIPLDPNDEQDHARFSQKIAEYLSSGTPVITNNVGEIPNYFIDKQNIICSQYSEFDFFSNMVWVINNPSDARKIGEEGYRLGEKEFNYRIHGERLHDFFNTH